VSQARSSGATDIGLKPSRGRLPVDKEVSRMPVRGSSGNGVRIG
jgi:hypothetical protein